MFVNLDAFWEPRMIYPRAAYLISRGVRSHRNLLKIARRCYGEGSTDGIPGIFRAAVRALGQKRGRPRCAFYEIVVSTAKGAFLEEEETFAFAQKTLDNIGAASGVIGAHWHRDGRTDIHILVPNAKATGRALSAAMRLPSTGRPHRNIKLFIRQTVDRLHDELNRQRDLAGKPRLVPMSEQRAKTSLARGPAWPGERKRSRPENDKLDTPKSGTVSATQTLPRLGAPDWEELVRLIWQWRERRKEKREIEEELKRRLGRYFANLANARLVREVEQALQAGCDAHGPAADEAQTCLLWFRRDEGLIDWQELTGLAYARLNQSGTEPMERERLDLYFESGTTRLVSYVESALRDACKERVADAIEAAHTVHALQKERHQGEVDLGPAPPISSRS